MNNTTDFVFGNCFSFPHEFIPHLFFEVEIEIEVEVEVEVES